MYGSDCHVMDDPPAPPNGSKVVTLLFRLSTLALALTSAVVMATASECTIYGLHDGAAATATVVTFKDYQPFVYLVGSNIAATILEVAAIYLQVVAGNKQGGDGDDEEDAPPPPMINPRVVLVAADVAVQVLLYSATGAVFAAAMAYGPQISACAGAASGHLCEQVRSSKIISLAASLAAGLASIAKDVPLPFSVWPHM
ncbi:CASP-like protein 1U2 [Miscanthus floridulus]|uniref:CASP-like protein 1U2 n=1 Tax=Miscanthus floridulus TaxID=154761 RepID=UPI00345A8D0F